MNAGYGSIMHDRHGYFIGRCCMGRVRRLSREYFRDASSCLHAIRTCSWTRRSPF